MAQDPSESDLKEYKRPVLPHERKADPAVRAGGLATAGIEFAMIVGVFGFGGWWLDGQLGSDPWLFIILTLLGVGAAMAMLIRQVTRMAAATEADKQKEKHR